MPQIGAAAMPMTVSTPQTFAGARVGILFACAMIIGGGPTFARDAADVAGVWDIARDQGQHHCRISLNGERTDKGDFFAGIPVACRRSMPILAKAGRWTLSDATHLALTTPAGTSVLDMAADGDSFTAQGSDGSAYRLTSVHAAGRSATGVDSVADLVGAGPPTVIELAATKKKPVAVVSNERPSDLAGRYAVLRDKMHDTGCMLTLDDKTKVRGGDRAALAPACRDQGIVVFDPSAWQIINGRLVLTAKAGHTTHLDKQADGTWLKDPGEGKSLTLKKL